MEVSSPRIQVNPISLPDAKIDLWARNARSIKILALILSDFISLYISIGVAVRIRFMLISQPVPDVYAQIFQVAVLVCVIYILSGVYVSGLGPVDELRKLTISTSVNFLALATLSFWFRNAIDFSRLSYLLAWVIALIAVPLAREITRTVLVRLKRWGEPVIIIGNGLVGCEIAEFLLQNPKTGFVPVAVIDRRKDNRGIKPKYAVIRASEIIDHPNRAAAFEGIQTAILITSEISEEFYNLVMEDQVFKFNRLIIVSKAQQMSSLWVQPYDIGGVLGLEVKHNLLDKWQNLIKRATEFAIILACAPFLVPIFLLITLAVCLDLKGGPFYAHTRIGFGGSVFKVLKFRTMHTDSDKVLANYLEHNADARIEWDETHKLKNDPRITRTGKLLRKLSLDELPQLINVLKGEMSLVGPRPIVKDEVKLYGKRFNLYTKVLPGITGLWQVSGRNDVSYDTRVRLDEYYVRNWSIWLDLHIFSRTGWVVLTGKGSY